MRTLLSKCRATERIMYRAMKEFAGCAQVDHVLSNVGTPLSTFLDYVRSRSGSSSDMSEVSDEIIKACNATYYYATLVLGDKDVAASETMGSGYRESSEPQYGCYLRSIGAGCHGCTTDLCSPVEYVEKLRERHGYSINEDDIATLEDVFTSDMD